MVDISNKRRAPMQTPDQVEYLRQLILDYNGDALEYQNIEAIFIDAGAGGAGKVIADMLMQDWVDSKGKTHRGVIDKETDQQLGTGYSRKYPNAIDKVKLIEPGKYKSIMYEEAIEMTNNNLVSFTSDYDNKGYLTIFETDEKELNKEKKRIEAELKKQGVSDDDMPTQVQEKLKNASCMKTKMVKLDAYQEIALSNIDALKEEMVNIVRKKRDSGKDSFDLTPEKANKLHDDRFYCSCLAAYYLSEKRRSSIINRRKPVPDDINSYFKIKTPEKPHSYFS
jgi:hypothetical protein